jgi:hypothetical protein
MNTFLKQMRRWLLVLAWTAVLYSPLGSTAKACSPPHAGPTSNSLGPFSFPEFYFSQDFIPSYIINSTQGNPYFQADSKRYIDNGGRWCIHDKCCGMLASHNREYWLLYSAIGV